MAIDWISKIKRYEEEEERKKQEKQVTNTLRTVQPRTITLPVASENKSVMKLGAERKKMQQDIEARRAKAEAQKQERARKEQEAYNNVKKLESEYNTSYKWLLQSKDKTSEEYKSKVKEMTQKSDAYKEALEKYNKEFEKEAKERLRKSNKESFDKVLDTAEKVVATPADVAVNVTQGFLNIPEGIADAVTHMIAQSYENKGNKAEADRLRRNAMVNQTQDIWLGKAHEYLDEKSYMPEIGDEISQGVGYSATLGGLNMIPGAGKIISDATLMTSAMGSGLNEAFSVPEVSSGKAWTKAVASAGIEVAVEKLFGILGYGGSSIDDMLQSTTKNIKNGLVKAIADTGLSATGEAIEELLSYAGDFLLSHGLDLVDTSSKMGYEWNSEEVFRNMFVGFMSAGVSQGPVNVMRGVNSNTNQDALPTATAQPIAQGMTEGAVQGGIAQVPAVDNTQTTEEPAVLPRANEKVTEPVQVTEQVRGQEVASYVNENNLAQSVKEKMQGIVERTNKISSRDVELRFEALEGNRKAQTDGNTITIDISKASLGDLIHEITHNTESGNGYTAMSDYILTELDKRGELQAIKDDIRSLYQPVYESEGRTFTDADLDSEIVARYTEKFAGDANFVNKITQADRNFAQKICDWIREKVNYYRTVKNLTAEQRAEYDELRRAEKLWMNALKNSDSTNNLIENNNKYSIKTDRSGNKYVEVDTKQDMFRNKNTAEQIKVAKNYILQTFRENGLLKDSEKVNVTRRTANEYTHPSRNLSATTFSSKLKSSTELANLLEISKLVNSTSDDGTHGFAKDGWDYYETTFRVGDKTYTGWLNIGKNDGVKTLYDITNIKERTSNYSRKTVSVASSSYKNSITSEKTNVNTTNNYSMHKTDKNTLTTAKDNNAPRYSISNDIANLPKLKNGYTRLYRGLTQEYNANYDKKKLDNNNGYESWTDSYELAKAYGDKVYYIDVPTSQISQSIIDEDSSSETYGDRNLIYENDKPVGIKGKSGKEYMLYTDHDNYKSIQYNKVNSNVTSKDNKGRQLTKEQQDFFKDSQAKDEKGNLMVMYHGTPNGGFTKFDYSKRGTATDVHGVGDYGKGFYFTPVKAGAESYTSSDNVASKKPQVYEVYLNMKNPLRLDILAKIQKDVSALGKKYGQLNIPDAEIDKIYEKYDITEDQYYEMSDLYSNLEDNWQDIDLSEYGYDGVINERRTEFVVFNSNQIKNADNTNPTSKSDIRYSLGETKDNKGRQLTKGQEDYFKDSKARDDNGNLVTVYHTTTEAGPQFYEFNPVGTLGYRYGDQVVNFFTDSKDMSGSYAGQKYQTVDTKKINNLEEANKWAKEYAEWISKAREERLYKIEENDGKYVLKEYYHKSPLDGEYKENTTKQEYNTLEQALKNVKKDVISFAGQNSKSQYEGYVDIKNPFEMDAKGANWNRIEDGIGEYGEELLDKLEQLKENDLDFKVSRMFYNVEYQSKKNAEKYMEYYKKLTSSKVDWMRSQILDTYAREGNLEGLYDMGLLTQEEKQEIKKHENDKISGKGLKEIGLEYFNNKYDKLLERNLAELKKEHPILDAYTMEDLDMLHELKMDESRLKYRYKKHVTTNDIVKKALAEIDNGADYDGVIIRNVVDYGGEAITNEPATVYVTFNSNQFKGINNIAPTKSQDIRYSLSDTKDNKGRELSEGQQEYFKDSKVRDEQGRLLEVYHGSVSEDRINIFNTNIEPVRTRSGPNGTYFTSNPRMAGSYKGKNGTMYAVYLDIKNPLNITSDIKKYQQKGMRFNEAKQKALEKLNDTHDGIIFNGDSKNPDEYVVFNSNQIKNVDNINPTANDDIRYSVQRFTPATELDTTQTYAEGRKKAYNHYKNGGDKGYDNKIVEHAKELVKANNQGRRTKDQWLKIADTIGANTKGMEVAQIEQLAYKSWFENKPNTKENLNRQGQKYVKFTIDEWINRIYESAKKATQKTITADGKTITFDDYYKENMEMFNSKEDAKRIFDAYYENQQRRKAQQEASKPEAPKASNDLEEFAEKPEGKERKHYKSISTSEMVGEHGRNIAKNLLEKDRYIPASNAKQLEQAESVLKNAGVESSLERFRNTIKTAKRLTPDDLALGERLIQIYSVNGDTATLNNLIQDVAIIGTELGQTVQALSLIRKMTPEGQLMTLQKSINRLNMSENTNIQLTTEQTKKIVEAKTDVELQEAISEVTKEIAEQLPLKMTDKLRSWRYLSMLGNPRTHIRNILSNVAMKGTKKVKDTIAGGLEDIVNPAERTRTLKKASKETKEFAKADANERIEIIANGGKYDISTAIKQSKKQFDNKVINALAEFNSNSLEAEDKIFLKSAYSEALAKYMTANNLTASYLQSGTKEANIALTKARDYATLEAQVATFRQFSWLASKISQIENKNNFTKVVVGGLLPFKKTPINIAKAGIEYSPVGLMKNLSYDAYQLKKGNITANEFIDNISKGLTGTSLSLIGYFLAQVGLLKASGDDDDRAEDYAQSIGDQQYAIKVGDKSITIDWLSPSAMPLFVGAEFYNALQGKSEISLNALATATTRTLNPLTEMSMLQSFASTLSSFNSEGSAGKLGDMGANMVESYLGQYFPTLVGQLARIIDDTERDTYYTDKKGAEARVQRFINKQVAKTPFLSKTLEPRVDVWGEEVKRDDNIALRAFNQLLNPAYVKTVKSSTADKEVQRLYKASEDSGVLPKAPGSTFSIEATEYKLTPEEYTTFKKSVGKYNKNVLNNIASKKEYTSLSDAEKIKTIDALYDDSREKAKQSYADKNNIDFDSTDDIDTLISKKNLSLANAYIYRGNSSSIKSDKDSNGETIDGSLAGNKAKYIMGINTTDDQKDLLLSLTTSSKVKPTVDDMEILGEKNYNTYYSISNAESREKYVDLVSTGMNTSALNKYINNIGSVEGKKNSQGKTISGTLKTAKANYINSLSLNKNEKLILFGKNYELSSSEKRQVMNYINGLNISKQQKLDIYDQLKGVTIKNGKVYW